MMSVLDRQLAHCRDLFQQDRLCLCVQAINELCIAVGCDDAVVDVAIRPAPLHLYPVFKKRKDVTIDVSKAHTQRARPPASPLSSSHRPTDAESDRSTPDADEQKNHSSSQSAPSSSSLSSLLEPVSADDVAAFMPTFEFQATQAFFSKAREQLRGVQRMMDLIHDDDDWNIITDSNGIKTMFRSETDTSTVSIKVHAIMDTSITNVLPIMNEVDLVQTFISRIQARKLQQVSLFRQLVHCVIKIPWPGYDRDMVMDGRGVDLTEHGQIAIIITGHDGGNKEKDGDDGDDKKDTGSVWQGVDVPPVPKNTIRIGIHTAGCVITPIDDTTTCLSMVINADPNVHYIPQSLLNWVTKHIAYYGVLFFRHQTHKIKGTKYEQRIKDKPEIYNEIQKRLDAIHNPEPVEQATKIK